MKEIIGNLFDPNTYRIMTPPTRGWVPCNFVPDAVVISTNGFVKTNGQCVMGRGCAKTAADLFPSLPLRLGSYIKQYGNRVFDMGSFDLAETDKLHLVTFPVKPAYQQFDGSNAVSHMRARFKLGDRVPGWACLADAEIIWRSCNQLTELADKRGWKKIVLPRPGAGAGELNWEDIRPILMNTIDDRFHVITFPKR